MVQVDKLGQAEAVAPATADYTPSDPQIAWYLAHFVEMVRSLPADPIIVRQDWLEAYDFVSTTSGSPALNDYARARTTRSRKLGKQQVAIDVSSVIRASPSSFRVEWVEHRQYQDDALAEHHAMDRDPHHRDPDANLRRRAPQEPARHLRHRHQLVQGAGTMTLPFSMEAGSPASLRCRTDSPEPERRDYAYT